MPDTRMTRRGFIANTVAATLIVPAAGASVTADQTPAGRVPWYRRAYLWGQTNITERDPVRYDIAWWRAQWKRTRVQAVIINAGGIVAYYPSKFPLHHRAEFLNGRDLFGELTKAAHDDGLFVMARMDSNRAAEDFFKAQPGLVRAQPRRASRIGPTTNTSRASTARTTTNTCPTSCARSSSAHTLKVSPTTVGRGSAAAASATATTARACSRRVAARTFLRPRTGTTPPTAIGFGGTTRAAWRSGT